LAHPKKLRVIAESTHKSDKIDAHILALALDMIPEAYRPSRRIRQYRVLVRHRRWLQSRITAVKCKLRYKAAEYNADVAGLFSAEGREHLASLANSLRSNRASERRPAPTKAPTPRTPVQEEK
jgi:hypothetical protein